MIDECTYSPCEHYGGPKETSTAQKACDKCGLGKYYSKGKHGGMHPSGCPKGQAKYTCCQK